MNEAEFILNELEKGHAGDPWHGPSRASVLADVTLDEAARRPGGGHTMWELVLHMTSWTREVARRLREGSPHEPVEGDWPPMGAHVEARWHTAVEHLDAAHADVIAAIRALRDGQLDEMVGADRHAPTGSGVSYREMLHGLAQHDAYHTGQISILKRLYRGADARATVTSAS